MHFRQVPRLVISFGQVQMECARSSDEGVLHWWPWQPSGHWSFPLVKRRSNSFKTGPLILQPPNFLNMSPHPTVPTATPFKPVLWLDRGREPQPSGHTPPITAYFITMLSDQSVFHMLTFSNAARCCIYLRYFANWQFLVICVLRGVWKMIPTQLCHRCCPFVKLENGGKGWVPDDIKLQGDTRASPHNSSPQNRASEGLRIKNSQITTNDDF